MDGNPSATKLIILPDASPIIKKKFEMVAANQNFGLKIPVIQSIAMLVYKPIVALRTCFKLFDSTVKSNNFESVLSGNKPYINPIIMIRIEDTVRCKFLRLVKLVSFIILKATLKLVFVL